MNTLRFGSFFNALLLLALFALPQPSLAVQEIDEEAMEEFFRQRLGVRVCNQDDCIGLTSRFQGAFFETLEVKGTPDAPVFLSNSKPVELFPEMVVLEITARGRSILSWENLIDPRVPSKEPAGKAPKGRPSPPFEPQTTDIPLEHDSMMNFWFKAAWKRNGKLHPVEDLMWDADYKRWRGSSGPEWYYTLTFSARDVPLTDTLVITVFEDSGKQITTLEASVPLGVLPYVHSDKKRD